MTPNEELAHRVVDALRAADLIHAADVELVRAGLADGSLRQRDWEAVVLDQLGEDVDAARSGATSRA